VFISLDDLKKAVLALEPLPGEARADAKEKVE
jgi:hypothetical protein